MKMVSVALAILVAAAGALLLVGGSATTAPAQSVGCPSCHGAAGKEPALEALAKAIKNHPVSAARTVTQCALCHTKGPTPVPFRTALHKIHLNSTKFASAYKGACTSCHSVDKATGTITVYGLER